MFWEGYVCEYQYDGDGDVCGVTEPIYVDQFNTFSSAMAWLNTVIDNHDDISRWYVKVYKNESDKKGDILCAFSMEWDDPIFNNDAV